jgi:ribonucleoside-diphosphate reductase alpha chain
LIEHAADRTPFVCQAQSLNIFVPADVHKRDLHQIHFLAWKKGVKSLYYCRSKSMQRAESANSNQSFASVPHLGKIDSKGQDRAAAPASTDYEECLACQ